MLKPIVCICFLVFFSPSVLPHIVESLPHRKDTETFKVGVTTTPFMPYWGGSLTFPQGLTHDIATLMENKLGVNIEYVAFPTIEDVKNAIADGSIDFTIGYLKSEDRKGKFLFSKSIYDDSVVGWITSEKSHIKDIKSLKWACLAGSAHCSILESLNVKKITKVSDYKTFYDKMNAKEVDALIGFYGSIIHYFKNNGVSDQEIFFDKLLGNAKSYLMTAIDNTSLINRLNIFIDGFDDNTFSSIYNKYNKLENIFTEWNIIENQLIIKYTVCEDLFPYSFFDTETGEYKGYIHDVFRRISSLTPLEFQYVLPQGRDTSKMLDDGIVDVVSIVKREQYSENEFDITHDIVDVKYSIIETTKSHEHHIFGILERFGYFRGDQRIKDFIIYNDVEKIFSDIENGIITHGYINQHLVENFLSNEMNPGFRVLDKNQYIDLDTKAPMLLRNKSDTLLKLLEEAFLLLPQRELDSMWNYYSKVEYHIGYHEKDIKIAIVVISLVLISIVGCGLFILSNMREKLRGAFKTTVLSEGQRRFLLDVINNIPSYICIKNEFGEILLSNDSFNQFSEKYNYANELDLLTDLLDKSEVESRDDHSQYLSVSEISHPLYGRFFHIMNKPIVHYVDRVILYMTVMTDITELKEREKFLLQANLDAEAAIQQKRNFLAIVSHELRTPISGILGIMELLDERLDDPLSKEMLHNASFSTSKLKLLVDDILDFSKLEAEQLRIHIDEHNLPLEFSPIIKSFESLAKRKGLTFCLDWHPTPYFDAKLDLLRVTQILSNVLSNAVKFTEQGAVLCRIVLSEKMLTIDVKDMGIGMDEEQLKHVFDPFIQAQDNIARRYGGTGLGMSIVKNLLDLMGGSISVHSVKDFGTHISMNIPVIARRYEATGIKEPFLVDTMQISQWLNALSIKHDYMGEDHSKSEDIFYPDIVVKLLSNTDVESVSNRVTQKMKLLEGKVIVVDDDPVNRFLIKMQLETLGLELVIVEQGCEVLSLLASELDMFDLLITDCHMPDLNGFDLTSKIRALDWQINQLPIIACTADNSDMTVVKAEKSGMNDLLYKPYDLIDLYSVLKRYLPVKMSSSEEALTACNDVPEHCDVWLPHLNDEDKVLMTQAIIHSLEYCFNEIQKDDIVHKSVIHRLKGTASALNLIDLIHICEDIELDLMDSVLKEKLVLKISAVLDTAKLYLDNESIEA